MSTPPPPPPPPSPSPSHFTFSLQNLGLGYAIAISLGFLVLFSALLLSSYICCRSSSPRRRRNNHPSPSPSSSTSVIVPRIIFVAEDDEDDDLESQNRVSNGVVGLDRAVINSYPKFQFFKNNIPQQDPTLNNHLHHNHNDRGNTTTTTTSSTTSSSDNSMCSICLCDYKDGEMLRMMPDCKHYFHLCCLDAWLKLNGSCPVCRNSPLPTPVSTPLAEVVPLSHYPDNRRRSTVLSSSS